MKLKAERGKDTLNLGIYSLATLKFLDMVFNEADHEYGLIEADVFDCTGYLTGRSFIRLRSTGEGYLESTWTFLKMNNVITILDAMLKKMKASKFCSRAMIEEMEELRSLLVNGSPQNDIQRKLMGHPLDPFKQAKAEKLIENIEFVRSMLSMNETSSDLSDGYSSLLELMEATECLE